MTFGSMTPKATLFVGLLVAATAPAHAQDYNEFQAETGFPYQRSYLTHRAICIPPYDRAFPVRMYTTPPQQPYYNVPPYPVVSPY